MQLNPDCIRDILFKCEECCTIKTRYKFAANEEFTKDNRTYSFEETLYHLRQCKLNDYFVNPTEDFEGNFTVSDLTPKAHEFLADIRSNSVWDKTKSIAKELGVFSLHGLSKIAVQVISAIINKHIGI